MVEAGAFRDMWVELVRGELHKVTPPGNVHSKLQVATLAGLLKLLPADRLRGELAVRLDGETVLGCDAAVLTRAVDSDGPVDAGELSLVVEIAVSTADRDLGLKRRLYAGAGVPTYWVVDAARSVVHVFDRPGDGDYAGLSLVRFGEPLAVPDTDGTVTLG